MTVCWRIKIIRDTISNNSKHEIYLALDGMEHFGRAIAEFALMLYEKEREEDDNRGKSNTEVP